MVEGKNMDTDHKQDSTDDEMYVDESSAYDDEDDGPTRHRLEWDNDL